MSCHIILHSIIAQSTTTKNKILTCFLIYVSRCCCCCCRRWKISDYLSFLITIIIIIIVQYFYQCRIVYTHHNQYDNNRFILTSLAIRNQKKKSQGKKFPCQSDAVIFFLFNFNLFVSEKKNKKFLSPNSSLLLVFSYCCFGEIFFVFVFLLIVRIFCCCYDSWMTIVYVFV